MADLENIRQCSRCVQWLFNLLIVAHNVELNVCPRSRIVFCQYTNHEKFIASQQLINEIKLVSYTASYNIHTYVYSIFNLKKQLSKF